MSAQAVPRISEEEYLRLDRAAEVRSEYHDGQMYSMAGGTYVHGLIVQNLATVLSGILRDRPCRVTTSDVRVRAVAATSYFYPDVVVVCGEPHLADGHLDILTNPVVIFEVLSPSTEAYDRGLKFRQYRAIQSLKEYILVSQTEHLVDRFALGTDGHWVLSSAYGLDPGVRLDALDLEIPLAEIYRKVTLTPAPPIPKEARVEMAE